MASSNKVHKRELTNEIINSITTTKANIHHLASSIKEYVEFKKEKVSNKLIDVCKELEVLTTEVITLEKSLVISKGYVKNTDLNQLVEISLGSVTFMEKIAELMTLFSTIICSDEDSDKEQLKTLINTYVDGTTLVLNAKMKLGELL